MEISPDQMDAVSDANRLNFADREVLSSQTTLGEIDWGFGLRAGNHGLVIVLAYLAHVLMGRVT